MDDNPQQTSHSVTEYAGPAGAEQPNAPVTIQPRQVGKRLNRRRRLLVFLAGFAVLLGLGWYAWRWYTTPVPPPISLDGVEPAVAETITAALDRVRDQPRSSSAWGHLGLVLRAHGYYDESNASFAQAERFDPRNPRWPYLQGLRWLVADPEVALPLMERAVALCATADPKNSAPELQLANLLLQMRRADEAEAHFNYVLEKEPHNVNALYGLGLAAYVRNDLQSSLAHLLRVSTSPFTRKRACAQIAAVYQRMGKKKAAVEYGRRADRFPKDVAWVDPYVTEFLKLARARQSRFLRVEEMEALGRKKEVIPLLRAIAEENPDDRSFVALGIRLAKAGNLEEAEGTLRTAIRLAPDKIQAHYFLALSLYYQGEQRWKQGPDQRAKAIALFRAAAARAAKATELKPDHGYAHIYRGLALKKLGRQAEAIRCLRAALHCRPEYVDSHFYLGEMLAEAGQVDEAIAHLTNAAQLAGTEDRRPGEALARLRKLRKP
jgi:tetratricopeptide (TPR) repeat protein